MHIKGSGQWKMRGVKRLATGSSSLFTFSWSCRRLFFNLFPFPVCKAQLKVPKCEILMSSILMIFFYHEVYIGRGLEGRNKFFSFFTDGWDTGHFVLATAWAVYASKLLPYAPSTLAKCYRMRRICLQFATVCAVYASKTQILHGFATACAV